MYMNGWDITRRMRITRIFKMKSASFPFRRFSRRRTVLGRGYTIGIGLSSDLDETKSNRLWSAGHVLYSRGADSAGV